MFFKNILKIIFFLKNIFNISISKQSENIKIILNKKIKIKKNTISIMFSNTT